MLVGHVIHIGDDPEEPVEHIWRRGELYWSDSLNSMCGMRRLERLVGVTRRFDLGVWDAKDTVPFRRCVRCEAWRRSVGEETIVAERLISDDRFQDLASVADSNLRRKRGKP